MEIRYLASKSGEGSIEVNGYLLHSKYDPIKEATRIAKENYCPHYIHVVFGYGKGYIVDQLIEEIQYEESILIIDPLVEKGKLEVESRHFKKGIFYWDEKDVNTLTYMLTSISEIGAIKIKVIISPNYEKIFPNELKKVLGMIKDHQEGRVVNDNTITFFSKLWQENMTKNMINILQDESLVQLEGFSNKPVVVASGGPSLTKHISLLKKMRKQILLVAAGSTINSLISYGIEPDFVVSIDGGDPNYNHFKDLELKYARLIYTPFNHHGIRASFKQPAYVFLANNQESICAYFKKFDQNFVEVLGGGTVAQYAYSIAQYISTGPIAIIGQDLAYTNNQTHAEGNKNIDRVVVDSENEGFKETEGYYGDTVITSRVLYSMKRTFEDMMRFHPPKVEVYNCTEGGVKIKGYNQISFKDFYIRYVKEMDDSNLSIPDKGRNIDITRFISIFKQEIITYRKIIRTLKDNIILMKRVKREKGFSQKILNRLDKTDERIAKLYPQVQMDFLVTPITMAIERSFLEKEDESSDEKFERIFTQSYTLYENLLRTAEIGKKYTEEIIEEINNKENA